MRTTTIVAAILATVLIAGCTPVRQSTGPQHVFQKASQHEVAAYEYRVAPPDKLTIRAPAIKEFDGMSPTIRPDGKIYAGIIGEVYVANKTPEEIGRILTDRASKYYNLIDIKVEVTEYASKFYYVTGLPSSVGSGGKKPFTGRDTVISALAEALLGEDAWPEQVSLARSGKNGKENSVVIINFAQITSDGDTRQNFLLEEGDIIKIPDRPMSSFRKRVLELMPIGSAPAILPTPARPSPK